MDTGDIKQERAVGSVSQALVLASGAVATAFGILAAAHITFGAVQLALGIV
jgi:hypothetical protein